MATSTLVPLSEYLQTSYRPDRDWIAGELRERNMGEQPHAALQAFLVYIFRRNAELWGVRVLPEQRVQTSTEHYRIADLCVVRRGIGEEPIVRTPPLLCVEILSRDDRMSEIQERVDDYLLMGVRAVWVIDPRRRRAYISTREGGLLPEPEVLKVSETAISVPVPEVFAELDDLEQNG
jgi:Uma2 family endonuclease